jgi:hypothetical protein
MTEARANNAQEGSGGIVSRVPRAALCGVLFVIVVFSLASEASAFSYYSIELIPARWNRTTIPVEIDTENQTLHNLASQALDTWNAAQEWFHTAYDPNGKLYKFQVDRNGLVTIGFGTVYEYVNNSPVPLPCSDCSGIADSEYDRGVMKRVEITVSTSSFLGGHAFSEAGVLGVLMHELGHALGLGHTPVTDDLMYKSADTFATPSYSVYPSTLDLFGVASLARVSSTSTRVALPKAIPYMLFPVKRQLMVNVPEDVSVAIDGATYPAGTVQVSLDVGFHTITLPVMVQVNQGTRLLFNSWLGAGSAGAAVTYELVLNANLTAIYITQYSLVIKGYDNRTLNTYWYNSGARAAFVPPPDVIQSVTMQGPFGELGAVWRLTGWSDNGQPISPNTSFVMARPHTIQSSYSADYTTPIVLISILGVLSVTVTIAYWRKRAGNS